MDEWCKIRHRVLNEGVSTRQIQRETGFHYNTVKRILTHSSPPEFQCPERPKPKIGPYLERIAEILASDRDRPKKQRHTAKRIFERLRDEDGYTGGYTVVKDAVRELRHHAQEVFMPLTQAPGEAQMDFGQALVKIDGVLRKAHFFVMALPYSDAMFVAAYPRECTETFQDGHVRAFRFFEGVPRRIAYDNARTSVSQILGAHRRKLTHGFLQLKSHYLFEEHFCRVRRPNEKGVVEGFVKYARLNYFVPVPEFADFEELNAYLEACCREDLNRTLRGKAARKAELLKEDRDVFCPLPDTPIEASRNVSTTVNSLSLVRFDCNDYSVPTRYAHNTVVVKGYVDTVKICRRDEVIAEDPRVWEKEQVAFDPVHYLQLLERKPGALDHARPLEGWELPECFTHLREKLEVEAQARGTREFIRVLRLLERHSMDEVAQAIKKALKLHRVSHDVVAHYLFPQDSFTPPTFPLDGREHLKGVVIHLPDISVYGSLMQGGRS
jgi:transposase